MKALAILGIISGTIIRTIVRGWVLTKLWLWFVVSTFGLPTLRIPQAIGLSLLVGLLTFHFTDTKQEDGEFGDKAARAFFVAFFLYAFVLLTGWVTHLFL